MIIGLEIGTKLDPTGIGIVKLMKHKIAFSLLVRTRFKSVIVDALLQQRIEKTDTIDTPLGGAYTS
jgi:hypothetical protein